MVGKDCATGETREDKNNQKIAKIFYFSGMIFKEN